MRVIAVSPEFIGRSAEREPVPPSIAEPFPEKLGFYWAFKFGRYLRKYHSSFDYVFVRPGREHHIREEVVDGIRVVSVPRSSVSLPLYYGSSSSFSPQLAKVVAGIAVEDPDTVVHVHEYHTLNSLLVMRMVGHRLVLQNHGVPPPSVRLLRCLTSLQPTTFVKLSYYELTSILERKILSSGNFFFVLTESERSYLESIGVSPSQIRIQSMGVDFEQVHPVDLATKLSIRSALGISESDLVAIYVGNIDHEKGAHWLPRLKKEIERSGHKIAIVALGLPIDRALAKEIAGNGILVLGRRSWDETIRLIASADIFVWPATKTLAWGGIGVSVLEALATNVPVVSPTLIHLSPRVTKPLGGVPPWVDDEKSFEQFSRVAKYVLANRDSFRDLRLQVQTEYDWKNIITRTVEVYEDILRNTY